jgi:hypothetical protein
MSKQKDHKLWRKFQASIPGDGYQMKSCILLEIRLAITPTSPQNQMLRVTDDYHQKASTPGRAKSQQVIRHQPNLFGSFMENLV